MKFKEHFTPQDRIELLERWIMVQSYIYYELDQNIVSDHTYNMNSQQLVGLMNAYPEEYERSRYYSFFYDFDGSTGYHLVPRVKTGSPQLYIDIQRDANIALDAARKRGGPS